MVRWLVKRTYWRKIQQTVQILIGRPMTSTLRPLIVKTARRDTLRPTTKTSGWCSYELSKHWICQTCAKSCRFSLLMLIKWSHSSNFVMVRAQPRWQWKRNRDVLAYWLEKTTHLDRLNTKARTRILHPLTSSSTRKAAFITVGKTSCLEISDMFPSSSRKLKRSKNSLLKNGRI